MLAYRLGRLDVAKMLIDAGADQSTKDYGRNNLLHAALYAPPAAEKLKPMLDLLDRSTLIPMLKERNKVDQDGRTPLHQYCATVANSTYYQKKDVIRMIKLLISISPETAKQALKMLDGAGDTPLHTLLAKDADRAVVRTIIDFDQSLLCCENAVGRTPAEVAHDRYLADNIKNPNIWRCRANESVSTLVTAPLSRFVKKDTSEEPKEHEAKSTVAKNWRLCAETMARNGQPKRTLVSLNSANFVAQRLGEQHMKYRYRVELVKKNDEDDAVLSTDSQDDVGEVDEAERAKPAAPVKKTKHRWEDVISSRWSAGNCAWAVPEKEKADGEESDDSESSSSDEKTDDEDDPSLYLMSPIVTEAKVVVVAGDS
jgi:hypothetical protein